MEICVENLVKKYASKCVLENYCCKIGINQGEIVGLVGPNGAGKTTLMKVIAGVLGYESGCVQIDDMGVRHYERWCKEHVVLINTGNRGLRYKSSVYDNVLFFLRT